MYRVADKLMFNDVGVQADQQKVSILHSCTKNCFSLRVVTNCVTTFVLIPCILNNKLFIIIPANAQISTVNLH